MAKRLASIGALCLSLVLGGCGGGGQADEKAEPKTEASAAELAQLGLPRIEPPDSPPPIRLRARDIREGSGVAAAIADEVTVDYAGADYETGVERWRSRGRPGPLSFQLGGSAVIPGWEKGIVGMRVGGRRELIVPSSLATGKGARIYVIDLRAVHRQTDRPIALGASDGIQDADKPTVALPKRPPRGLVVRDRRRGSGPAVEIPAAVKVKYMGIDYRTYRAFFNSWGPNRVVELSLEDPRSVWAEGLAGMRVGGLREVLVPARLGYGSGPLIYAIELLSIE